MADTDHASMPSSSAPGGHRDRPSGLLPAGRRIGSRYSIVSSLGEGATGIVYLARRIATPEGAATTPDAARDDRVALKVIHRHLCGDRQIFGRFRREAAILKRLEGEHLVGLLDAIEDDGLLALALEYVDGPSLEKVLAESGPLDLETTIEIGLQICAALSIAHDAGVVHRDLKPGNVLVERRKGTGGPASARHDGGLRIRVVDFGLAKVVHGEKMSTGLTEHDMIFGTPEYMAPEQARGDEVDARCDIYAAGVMLYEMAVGAVPFGGRTPLAAMTAHLAEEPPPPRTVSPGRGISPALEAVILQALAKEPRDRYPSARALAAALAAARDRPLVITPVPASVTDPAGLGVGDTDPHLPLPASLAHSITIPAAPPLPTSGGRAALSPQPPKPNEAGSARPTATAASFADTLVAPPLSRPARRWLWAAIAVVAACVGVLVGVLAGTR